MFKFQCAFYLFEGQRRRAAAGSNGHFDQVQDAARGRHGALEKVDGFRHARQGPEQALGQEHQHAVGAGVQVLVSRAEQGTQLRIGDTAAAARAEGSCRHSV